ncbi:MAG: hypothetical protein K6E41_04485 [Solobacterium sp.]|nr:hypothetical protein [Solobacterium sp.]
MSVIVNSSGGVIPDPAVTVLASWAGRNGSRSYTFTEDHKTVIISAGGYSTFSIGSGSGWNQIVYTNNDTNRAYAWKKNNVHSGESVTVNCGDRYGLIIYGID